MRSGATAMTTSGVGPETSDKSLAAIVGEISDKASLIVREEVELAKAELQVKVSRLIRGAAAGAAAGFFGLFALLFLLHALAWGISTVLDNFWSGVLITGVLLLAAAGAAVLLALRFVRRGTPPTPELAIEEARRTKAAIDEARS